MAELEPFDVVLLDIEGTICPISFVKDILFPYAITALEAALPAAWPSPSPSSSSSPSSPSSPNPAHPLAPYLVAFPPEHRSSPSALLAHVRDLSARDVKDPRLKALQGRLWRGGYAAGRLKCPVFADVPPALRRWVRGTNGGGGGGGGGGDDGSNVEAETARTRKRKKKRAVIYSSGSVAAQKLLWSNTDAPTTATAATASGGDRGGGGVKDGDLTPLLSGYFDTVNAGPKNRPGSYAAIVGACTAQWAADDDGGGGGSGGNGWAEPRRWLFLSDNVREVEAALAAGMQAAVVVRVGNQPLGEGETQGKVVITDFGDIREKNMEEEEEA